MRQPGPDDELEVVYELRSDTALVSSMKALSRDPERPNLGLAPDPYLIGSRRFWRHLGTDRLPTTAVEGKITRVFWTGMGDHPSFEITASDGSVHEFTRYGDPSRYAWGLRARVESVDMPWKPGVDQFVSPLSRLVTRVLVEPSPARSDSRAPGPFGVMLLQEHETSRVAWGLRCFEHWLQIEGIGHPGIDDLIEHIWSWLSITEETFQSWYGHPPSLVTAPAAPLGLELDADTAEALTGAIADATSLAYDNLFAGFDHDHHIVFAASLGHLLLPHGVNLPDPEAFRLPDGLELARDWGPIPQEIVREWRRHPIPWPQYSTVTVVTDRYEGQGARRGASGAIVEVYENAYEVEIVSPSGRTEFLGPVTHEEVEFVAAASWL